VEFVVSTVALMIGVIALRLLITLVAWLRSLRIVRAASRPGPDASSSSLADRQEFSAAQPQ
jgi:hypothetical protein